MATVLQPRGSNCVRLVTDLLAQWDLDCGMYLFVMAHKSVQMPNSASHSLLSFVLNLLVTQVSHLPCQCHCGVESIYCCEIVLACQPATALISPQFTRLLPNACKVHHLKYFLELLEFDRKFKRKLILNDQEMVSEERVVRSVSP